MNFFPPSQLPPMRGREEESSERGSIPQRTSIKWRIASVAVSVLLGLGSAAAGYYLSGNPAWFAAIPIALAFGWFVATNTKQSVKADLRRSGNAPILW